MCAAPKKKISWLFFYYKPSYDTPCRKKMSIPFAKLILYLLYFSFLFFRCSVDFIFARLSLYLFHFVVWYGREYHMLVLKWITLNININHLFVCVNVAITLEKTTHTLPMMMRKEKFYEFDTILNSACQNKVMFVIK